MLYILYAVMLQQEDSYVPARTLAVCICFLLLIFYFIFSFAMWWPLSSTSHLCF